MAEDRHQNRNDSQDRSGYRRRYTPRPRFCQFCAEKNLVINYKDTGLLRRYTTEEGKIRPRRQTGACAKHQRKLAQEIKRARHIALLPFTGGTWEDTTR